MVIQSLKSAIGWNAAIFSFVFLPVFIIASLAEVRLRGAPPLDSDVAYHASAGLVMYLVMIVPLLGGSSVHAIISVLIGFRLESRASRFLVALMLAPLAPGFVVLLSLPGSVPLSVLLASAGVATVVAALCSAAKLSVRRELHS